MNFIMILINSQESKFCWDFLECVESESDDGEHLDVVVVSIPPLQGLACLLRVWQELVAFGSQVLRGPLQSFPAGHGACCRVSQQRAPAPPSTV